MNTQQLTRGEKELSQQYHYRASVVADIMGKWHGSSVKKATQRVLKEPGRWTIWAMSLCKPIIPYTGGKIRFKWTPLLPVAYLFSFAGMAFVRYLDDKRRKFTLKQAEGYLRINTARYLETRGKWIFASLVDTRGVLKADARIAKDPEYGNKGNLTARTQGTVATVFLGTPLDDEYPLFTLATAKQPRWQRWLGLKPTDSPLRIVWKAFWKPFKAGIKGDFTLVRDMNSHFTATGIAREQGYNKGRVRNPNKREGDTIQSGFIHREVPLIDRIDSGASTTADIDSFENQDWILSAKLSPQEALVVTAWQSGELPIPGQKRPHSTVKNFALDNGLSYQSIRTIENRAKRKMLEAYKK